MVESVAVLRDPGTIRARAHQLLALGRAGALAHFAVDDSKLPDVVARVVAVTTASYPDLRVPIHGRYRHFEEGGVDRLTPIRERLAALPSAERAGRLWAMTLVSVLLDAGAGPAWRYLEAETGRDVGRSEGLAIATLRAFERGALSDDPHGDPLSIGTKKLRTMSAPTLGDLFQVSTKNPLVGLEGRAGLLSRLGESLGERRLGERVAAIMDRYGTHVTARALFAEVLEETQRIWPVRHTLDGESLGDVWPHPALGDPPGRGGWVPFHKLTQWLTYSLIEPLGEAGVTVRHLDELTGLPEYRNGGLLLDLGVLVPKSSAFLGRAHPVESEAIVELRALTVALLDAVAEGVRAALGKTAESMPLAAVLQGGTWSAGRAVARERREGGTPPFDVISDGTVF
jgi:hypothetical protein